MPRKKSAVILERIPSLLVLASAGFCVFLFPRPPPSGRGRPNVVLIMTDDQGYGDLACHGNPVIKNPAPRPAFFAESVRLTDFHVSPFCTPTRAALVTGRYPARTGAYRTSSGRSMLHTDETTMAEVFCAKLATPPAWSASGTSATTPRTGRRTVASRTCVWHRGGGIGQAADYWGNDYFDDTYERNGDAGEVRRATAPTSFSPSPCASSRRTGTGRSFLYLATNAPHSAPLWSRKSGQPRTGKRCSGSDWARSSTA